MRINDDEDDDDVIFLKIEGSEGIYEIEQIIMHEHLGEDDAGYDIALLKLSRDLRYTAAVRPICLPDHPVPDGTNCVASGWGDTQGRLHYCFNRLNQLPCRR